MHTVHKEILSGNESKKILEFGSGFYFLDQRQYSNTLTVSRRPKYLTCFIVLPVRHRLEKTQPTFSSLFYRTAVLWWFLDIDSFILASVSTMDDWRFYCDVSFEFLVDKTIYLSIMIWQFRIQVTVLWETKLLF